MDKLILLIFIVILVFVIFRRYRKSIIARREKLIDTYCFPDSINKKIAEKYPYLCEQDIEKVMDGLREYFHLCNIAGKRIVSMPSQVVDVAWHEFILFTKKYEYFCSKALGRFLHHTPAEAMKSPVVAQDGIKTAWKISCSREKVDPKKPVELPLLFALDAQLNIPDGFKYSLDCKSSGSNAYCAGHIGCGSGCGGGCSGDSGDGCGGGGCGGD